MNDADRDLRAEAAIRRVLATYARGVDRMDWDLLRSCYHADAIDLHGTYDGHVEGFLDYLRGRLPQYERTMHQMHLPVIELDADGADVETYCAAFHRIPPDEHGVAHDWTVLVRYLDRFEERHGEWRIVRREVLYESDRLEQATPTRIVPGMRRGTRSANP